MIFVLTDWEFSSNYLTRTSILPMLTVVRVASLRTIVFFVNILLDKNEHVFRATAAPLRECRSPLVGWSSKHLHSETRSASRIMFEGDGGSHAGQIRLHVFCKPVRTLNCLTTHVFVARRLRETQADAADVSSFGLDKGHEGLPKVLF